MWLAFKTGIFTCFLYFFQLTPKKPQKTKKIKEEILKHIKESIMNKGIANQNIENTAKNSKSLEEAMEVVKEIEKIIRSNKCSILWLGYQQVPILERFKLNDYFMNMVNQFGN